MASLTLDHGIVRGNKCNKKTRAAGLKKARQRVKGLQLGWSDVNPLIDTRTPESIFNKFVTHVNPVYRLVANQMWEQFSDWILTTEFTWAMTLDVVYKSNRGDGVLKKDSADFKLTFAYKGDHRIDEAAREFVETSLLKNEMIGVELGTDHKSYGQYIQCDFVIEIVGV
jgi:hypothetical protein